MELGYLKKVMLTMGLDTRMVELIMGCVSLATFSILIDGIPKGHIVPSQGLRRQPPLSLPLLVMHIGID